MSGFIGNVALPNWTQINSLFSPDQMAIQHNQALASAYAPDAASLANQTNQQNLDDRGALRVLAPGLASTDPSIRSNALASAAVLPTVGGVNTVDALSNDAARTSTARLNLLQYGNTLPQLPYGGTGTSPAAPNPLASTPQTQVGGQLGGQTDPIAPGFLGKMSGRESGGNAQSVNQAGYSGRFQFGTGRMTDLGMYQPVQGENPNGNQWAGTVTVPGFAPMSHQDFLNNSDAQRMAAQVHFTDIGNQIDNTPGAQDYNRAGLAAVAQLGGVHGMQQFVATGGKYNPHDSNGTSLQNYYDKFASGGAPALQGAFGHPAGPLPASHPAQQQVASAANTNGMQQTATDASPTPMPIVGTDAGVPAGTTQASTPQQVSDLLNSFRRDQANGIARDDDGSGVAVDPSYLANKNTPAPGQGMTSTEAVAQASRELGDRLSGVDAKTANDLVQQRALQLINSSMIGSPAPPLAGGGPVSNGPQVPSSMPVGPANVAALPSPGPNPPRPVIPGSSIMTTAPFADQRFPPAGQAGQPAGVTVPASGAPGMAAGAPLNVLYQPPGGQTGPSGQGQAPASSPSFDPMAGLPPGSKPITMGPARVPMGDPNVKGNGLAQAPDGSVHSYRLAPPEASRIQVKNPDGSSTVLDTLGHPLFTSAPNTRDIQIKDYEDDRKSAGDLAEAASSAQSDQIRLQHALTLSTQLRSGANGGSRAEWANLAETYLPTGLAQQFSQSLIGSGGAGAAQQFDKLMVQSAGSQERGVLGARGGYQATTLFMKANPGLNMQGAANQDILNMQLIGKQADADYAQGAVSQFNQNGDAFRSGKSTYQPLTQYDQGWLNQRNPQVYAAAMGAAAGQPFAKWTEGLNMKSPADVQRVVDIVRRAKPNSSIQWANGQPQLVGSN